MQVRRAEEFGHPSGITEKGARGAQQEVHSKKRQSDRKLLDPLRNEGPQDNEQDESSRSVIDILVSIGVASPQW